MSYRLIDLVWINRMHNKLMNVFVVEATGSAPGCQWCRSIWDEFYLTSQDVGHLSTITHVPLVIGNRYCDTRDRLIESTQLTAVRCGRHY